MMFSFLLTHDVMRSDLPNKKLATIYISSRHLLGFFSQASVFRVIVCRSPPVIPIPIFAHSPRDLHPLTLSIVTLRPRSGHKGTRFALHRCASHVCSVRVLCLQHPPPCSLSYKFQVMSNALSLPRATPAACIKTLKTLLKL